MCTWYRPLTSPRHVNFQRCVFQTKLEGGMGAECAASAQPRLSNLRKIMNNTKKKMSPVGQDLRESCAVDAVSGAESFGCAAPCETCAESLTVLPDADQQHFQQHLCLLRDAPPGICFLLLLFYRKKSLGDDAEAQQPLSCSFVPTRTCQLINCASRLCAAPQLLCPISARLLLYRLYILKKGGSTMTSSRWATWAFHALPENVLIRRAYHRDQNNMNVRSTATWLLLTLRWKGRKLSLNKIWKSRNGCARCLSASLRLSPFNWLSNLSTSVRQKKDKADSCQ